MAKRKSPVASDHEQDEAHANVDHSSQSAPAETTVDASAAPRPHGKRRREDLFLGDTELFAFDFGGAATTAAVPEDEEANQAEAARQVQSKELEVVTSRLAQEAGENRRTPLTLEQVQQCAAAARRSPLTQFFFFPGPGSAKRTTRAAAGEDEGGLAVGTAPRPVGEEVSSLTAAHTYFANGLRKYDEGLWRARKAKKEEEKSKKKNAKQQGTSAK